MREWRPTPPVNVPRRVMDNDSEQLPWYRDSELVDPPFQLVKCFKVRKACISTTSVLRRTRMILEP